MEVQFPIRFLRMFHCIFANCNMHFVAVNLINRSWRTLKTNYITTHKEERRNVDLSGIIVFEMPIRPTLGYYVHWT